MKFRRSVILASVTLALVGNGCDSKPQYPLPMTQIEIGGQPFGIEIAVSDKDQETGLMHRDHLDPDHGMIFISDHPQIQKFWNHEVHFPLDLVFLDPSGNIVSLKYMKPYDETNVPSDAAALYTIELLGGTADRLKLKVGDHITLPGEVLHPVVTVSH
jgi:uncharacterized membrane protein (UPF0127 family)